MYFDKAFHQHYLCKNEGGAILMTTSGTTANLVAGQIGLFNPQGTAAISSGTKVPFMLSVGSWHTVDQLSPQWGGLKEPTSSKIINPIYVTDFIKRNAVAAQNQIVSIGWDQSSASSVGPQFYCGTTYTLKIEGNGSPALWFFNKQMYTNIDAWGGCCGTNCSSGCTSDVTDAACIMLQWSDRIKQSPYLTSFYTPAVFIKNGSSKTQVYSEYDIQQDPTLGSAYVCNTADPGSVIAALQLSVAYVETRFNRCTFTPTDHIEVEPLILFASLVTQDWNQCAWNTTINTSVPNMFTQIQAPQQVIGLGQFTMRDILLSNSYRQNYFPDSMTSVDILRMRETENQDVILDSVNLSGLYDQIVIIHNVPRNYNPTGIHNNDRYALIINVPTGTDVSQFTTLFQACLTASNSYVTLVTY